MQPLSVPFALGYESDNDSRTRRGRVRDGEIIADLMDAPDKKRRFG
jgi:hypothetical protein